MKEKSILLSNEQRASFKKLLKLIKLKKLVLAQKIDMQTTSLSEATSTTGKRRFPTNKWQAVLVKIKEQLDLVSSQNKITKTQQQQAQALLDKLSNNADSTIEHTGDPLTEHAPNYVPRDADILLKNRFDKKTSYFWINGGIKKGKSSLLNQAKKECKQRGITYHLCDFKQLIKTTLNGTVNDYQLSYQAIFQFILTQTTKSNAQLKSTDFNDLCDEFESKFTFWRNASTQPDEEYFIAIDHLDNLINPHLIRGDELEANNFNPFIIIQFVLQSCLQLSRDLKNTYFALVVEDYLYMSAKISPLVSQAARIDLKPLTNEEIIKLWQIVKPSQSTIEINLTQAEIINERIGSDPLLIQCLLQDIAQNNPPAKPLLGYIDQLKQQIEDKNKLVETSDKTHLCYQNRVITTIKKIATHTSFADNIEELSYDELIERLSQLESKALDPSIHRSFERLGFIDDSNKLKPLIGLIINGAKSERSN